MLIAFTLQKTTIGYLGGQWKKNMVKCVSVLSLSGLEEPGTITTNEHCINTDSAGMSPLKHSTE